MLLLHACSVRVVLLGPLLLARAEQAYRYIPSSTLASPSLSSPVEETRPELRFERDRFIVKQLFLIIHWQLHH